jgi:GH24 family phage-related lysozyme (muramidase)
LRQATRDVWVAFSEPLEGIVLSIYADVKSLPTTGMGNLLPGPQSAALLPFRRPDGTLAAAAEKSAEWNHVRNGSCLSYPTCVWPTGKPGSGAPCFAHKGWRSSEANLGKLNGLGGPLKLTRDDVAALIFRELERFEGILLGYFPELPRVPVAAELGLFSMAWALGPHFAKTWPKFAAAFRAQDFRTCAEQCSMKGGGTIVQRNAKNRKLFLEAAKVLEVGADLDVLWGDREPEPKRQAVPAQVDVADQLTEEAERLGLYPEVVEPEPAPVSDRPLECAPVPAPVSLLSTLLAWLVALFVKRG